MKEIRFGTSGWRAIISEDFTFDNVRLVVQAIAGYLKSQKPKAGSQKVVVGYDTRFLSKEFADETAKVLSANNIAALLTDRDAPTPVISYHIIKKKAAGGINFTASHNPPEYNGIKFSPQTGGPATPDITKVIEGNIKRLRHRKRKPASSANEKLIEVFDPRPAYLKQIENIVDFKTIKKAGLKMAVDCLYGTSRGYLDFLLNKHGSRPTVLHDYLNPSFDGRRPEPAPENITELISLVRRNRLNLGLAADGDADRFGIIDSDGRYLTPNQVITLLFYHLLKTRKNPGSLVGRTVATTHMIDAIAKRHKIRVVETPVGFKYFVDILMSGKCVIAGEESGGLSIGAHLPEKDGILACLLIAEAVAVNKRPLREIMQTLYRTYGRFYSERVDIALSESNKTELIKRLNRPGLKEFAQLKILRRDLRDGCKLYLEGENWVLFRPSGTEPIVRCYFESKSKKALSELIRAGHRISTF